VIVGAETGNRKGKVIPKREWVEAIVNECRKNKIPVFLKNSLAPVWGEPLIQEYPWETPENAGAEA
jgi:protein gp37